VFDEAADPSVQEGIEQLAAAFPETVEFRRAPRQGVTLVRPDGYVAYSAHDRDGVAALGPVRSLLELQTS
jgi:hypothetical protein